MRQVEQAPSLAEACTDLRPEIELPGIIRWVRRRTHMVSATLILLKGLMPAYFQACEPTLRSFAHHLGIDPVLPALRSIAAPWLPALPPPLGLCPRPRRRADLNDRHRYG